MTHRLTTNREVAWTLPRSPRRAGVDCTCTMTDAAVAHPVSFRGTYVLGVPVPGARSRDIVVCGANILAEASSVGLWQTDAMIIEIEGRPDVLTCNNLIEHVIEARPDRLIAIGDGAVLDVGKRALVGVEAVDVHPGLVLAPCGVEPYRAVARFAVLDDGPGSRSSVQHERHASATVAVVPELLESLDHDIIAVAALDTLVQGIESLLSMRAQPVTRALATEGMRGIRREAISDFDGGLARARAIFAVFLVVEAFSSTRLGIAHAVASPLGSRLGITHDVLNGILGDAVVEFWAAETAGFTDVVAAFEVEPSVEAIRSVLAEHRHRAATPTLAS